MQGLGTLRQLPGKFSGEVRVCARHWRAIVVYVLNWFYSCRQVHAADSDIVSTESLITAPPFR